MVGVTGFRTCGLCRVKANPAPCWPALTTRRAGWLLRQQTASDRRYPLWTAHWWPRCGPSAVGLHGRRLGPPRAGTGVTGGAWCLLPIRLVRGPRARGNSLGESDSTRLSPESEVWRIGGPATCGSRTSRLRLASAVVHPYGCSLVGTGGRLGR
jgi:hypothetical protein